ncbi:putative HVA22-like protein g isoform X4 [Aegilops tauschii subsp. strangulata]|uniref:HVA22-like protein n=1 Tax=Aegilops tauschii subsp. strangulata TaxID=200361 RepID=A0A453PRP9_AEGTS|nr:putative HVA22-like protein g isoform X4 [Aegilops tauschii subsp. strangulata]XP_045086026.1 putative HVA22-like protein g isoform X4 [Aegilops tauschii subsp. strangulata]XP_045086027.1 putative HVA22-like protein g isoform X4 [Aegilops tauschii subsp. strangulata]XP_045086028.1 putative HVA22-like protein g isoform X4 [Aegilops tauschii subsp. strangulata]
MCATAKGARLNNMVPVPPFQIIEDFSTSWCCMAWLSSRLTETTIVSFGHCLINFTELLNTVDLCDNRWSIRVLVAMPTVVERFMDWAVLWMPMYGEAKLLLAIYLWHPSTRGAGHVYDGFLRPLVAWHEDDIDRGLLDLRARARDVTASQLKAATAIGQVWLIEAARCVSSQLQAARSGREGAAH